MGVLCECPISSKGIVITNSALHKIGCLITAQRPVIRKKEFVHLLQYSYNEHYGKCRCTGNVTIPHTPNTGQHAHTFIEPKLIA